MWAKIMRVTHQQIADKVGVSRTVVTHVLHRTPNARICEETRQAILRVAVELGYEPRDRATYNIGYVMSRSQLRLEAELSQLMLFEKSLRARGYRLTLASWQDEAPEALRDIFNAKTVDGVLCNTWRDGEVKKVFSPQLPWVLLSDEDGVGASEELVALDARATARNLAEHIIAYGHRRLGLIVHLADIRFHRNIIQGVRDAMSAAALPPDELQLIRPYYVEEIAAELLPMMERPDAPTALLAVTPGIAITTLYALRNAGYRVPGNVSVAALLDNERFQALPPVLTSTNALGEEFVESAVDRLFERMRNPKAPMQQMRSAGRVIERQSVSAPPPTRRRTKTGIAVPVSTKGDYDEND
jgi:LacI family transcriptional regulator